MYIVELTEQAENHLDAHIMAGSKILLKRIYKLLEELNEYPETGTGKPHKLKHEKSGIWSRRIDDKHRMLYTINKKEVIVISLWGHYNDK